MHEIKYQIHIRQQWREIYSSKNFYEYRNPNPENPIPFLTISTSAFCHEIQARPKRIAAGGRVRG